MRNSNNDICEAILVPAEALNVELTANNGKKKGKLIEQFAKLKAAISSVSENPSKYAMMVVSSRLAGPLVFDIMRETKKTAPNVSIIVALETDGDASSLQNLPFIDRVITTPIASIDYAQVRTLVGNNQDEKQILLAEIKSLGAEADKFQQLTADQLRGLVAGLKKLLKTNARSAAPVFSETDKKILNELILSRGRVSSLKLSKILDIPLTTLQRKRKRFENEFVETKYTLKYEKFGFRKAALFISTLKGNNEDVGEKLLTFVEVLTVHKSIGVQGIDLQAEVLIKDNHELMSVIDKVKSMNGVKDVIWSETVKEIGSNTDAMTRALKDIG